MIVSDKSLIKGSAKGAYLNIKCLYSNIPRDMRMHMHRVAEYAQVLLVQAKMSGVWDETLPPDIFKYSKDIFRLHDIGRYYIPVDVYNKVEELTVEEREEIKRHTTYALEAEKSVFRSFFPEHITPYFRQVAVLHHERIDGKGYPYGKKGEEIPFLAKVCAIADAYDGMVSWKPYKESMTDSRALEVLKSESGKQFHPGLVECFIACREEIEKINRTMNGNDKKEASS